MKFSINKVFKQANENKVEKVISDYFSTFDQDFEKMQNQEKLTPRDIFQLNKHLVVLKVVLDSNFTQFIEKYDFERFE